MTVSRVLNGHPNIRESTRARVVRAIEEINYTPSSIARALATQRAMRIGVLVDSPVQWGPNSTLRALEGAARDAGYAISAFSISDKKESQLAGATAAVTHLIELGHTSIAHLAGPLDWFDARAREEGWRDAVTDAGLTVHEPVVGDWTSDYGYEFGSTYDFSDVTAVFAANDQMALGLIHGLKDRGIRVPEDVSVVGFDDLPDARHFLPPLTTVRQDFAALGALALQLIISSIIGEDSVEHDNIEPKLIIRASTAPPRA